MANTVGYKTKRRTPKETQIKQGLQIGDTGTRILDGVIHEEYNPKLQDIRGIIIYDEMRRSDGTVRAAVLAVTLPILAANWYITPGSEEPADQDVADFVTECLFSNPKQPFPEFLRQALLSLPFGVMVFEKVFDTVAIDGKDRIVWDKLAPRVPRSIWKWAISGGLPGIVQNRSDGKFVEIPMEKLIVFVNEKEGENWWGTSILRAAYKHWFIKTTLEKIDAIAHERQGLGVPKIKTPENASSSDLDKAEDIAKNMRANSQAYVIEPDGYDIGFMDMMSSTTRDPANSMAYHSREIMKSVLAQFLELGSTHAGGTGGSRALSQDHSDLFLQSLEAAARSICGEMNKHIREIVDLNFDGVTDYPTLDFDGISTIKVDQVAQAYQTLRTAGAITAQDADETYFRDLLDMPELEEDGIRDIPAPTPANDNQDDKNDEEDDKQEASEPSLTVKKKFSEAFKPYRTLTFAERKVNFETIQQKMDELETQFVTAATALLHNARDAFMAAFTRAAHAGDTQAIKDATLKAQAEYAKIIKSALKSAFEFGKTNAAKEIDVQAPPNPAETLRQIDIQSDTIAEQQIAKIVSESKTAYVEALNRGESTTAALGSADAAAEETIDTLAEDTSAIVITSYVNNGRDAVFTQNSDDIYALQRSELLDKKTCNFCLSIDGRVVEKDDSFAKIPSFHSNCRGIWVAIMNDEQDKPAITGIPQTLRNRVGNSINDLSQPSKPITRAGTLARKEADRRAQAAQ
jgi:hypothetical protein